VQEVTGPGGGRGRGIVDGPRLPWVPEVQVPAAGWRSAEYSEREVKKEEELSASSGDQLWWGQKRHGKWKKHKRRGEYDENQDLLAHHRYTPPYNPLKENEGVPEREREEAVWGPWAQGDTTYWGAPRGIGYASARRGQAATLKGYY
jgi:hypothetical protein